jgi:nitric oxide reductase NorD protein
MSRLGERLEVLRGAHREAAEVLRLSLARLGPASEANLVALADLLCLIAAEAPDCALTLAERVDGEPALLDEPMAMRRWAVHGLQRHRDDVARRRQHFERGDPLAFADADATLDSHFILDRRDALLHYLAGFGCADFSLELHEPGPPGTPPPNPAVGEQRIFFPRLFAGIEPAQRDRLLRAAVAHAAAHLRYSPLARLAGNRQELLLVMISLIEDARVERLMVRQYPGLHALWGEFHTATRASAGFEFAGLAARLARALHDPSYEDANSWVDKGRRLFEEAAAQDLHDGVAFERIARVLAKRIEFWRLPLPDAWRVPPAYRDDNAVLWNRAAALPEDGSVAREDFELLPRELLPPESRRAEVDLRRRVRYPEWDHRLEAIRENWATVIESAARPHRASSARPRARQQLHRPGLERLPDRSIRLARLHEGDELDLNAVIDCTVSRRAGLAPDGRIFRRHGRRRQSTAVVLLMDLSTSTERFVPGSFTTVIEAERRAASIVAGLLDTEHDRVAVHGFSSNGRHEVYYEHIKAFDADFGAEQQARLARLTGRLSTRMGAALRHAGAALDAQSADHKVILMLTDGEPSDIDVFEDDYLVEDARHAVVSAAARGIRTFCLTLDRNADAYVRRIFGARNYLIAERAAAFASQTGQALVKLIAH